MGFLPHPRDVSLLHALFYLRSNGGFASILGLRGPPHDNEMLEGGADLLPLRIAEQLGDRVKLNSPVRRIRQDESGVEVECAGFRVRGKHCIVALPPVLAGRLEYAPPMPAMRDYLTQRMPIRGKVSAVCLYDTPFWLDQGLNGWGRTEKIIAWGTRTAQGRGALAVLVGIEESMALSSLTGNERRKIILEELAHCFGSDALDPRGFGDVHWAEEEYSRGCNSYCPTGVWTSYGPALRESVGRVHWAGTELAIGFVGQMEGAVRSGERTAAEVLMRLG
jgi:monoamine oxidase